MLRILQLLIDQSDSSSVNTLLKIITSYKPGKGMSKHCSNVISWHGKLLAKKPIPIQEQLTLGDRQYRTREGLLHTKNINSIATIITK